jgi:carbon-monoxide dehydrogenase medium subunit
LIRPSTLGEARRFLASFPAATLAAGCTDLVAGIREGCSPSTLISLQRVQELRTVTHAAGQLRIGALLTHDEGSQHPELRAAIPELGAAWSRIATVRIRFRGTIGGNLVARRFRYEMAVILGALDAQMEFSTLGGERTCAVDEFVRGAHGAPSAPSLLHHISVDTESLDFYSYDRSLRPVTTVSLCGRLAGSHLQLVAVAGSEYRRPVRLQDEVDAPSFAALTDADRSRLAGSMARQLPDWVGDYAGSADYRRRVVEVSIRRQLAGLAARRAPEGTPA